ncbi:hypothetical protein EIP91_008370 [Steccherinum ochraceum]|uniref:F-box domain-containing protein n=1 Tax=Steccherinum ochraceum TaxID=92696 RepID=A0A4R0RGQ7_9APHY|nr:hypothetical protein EIP91_008370 [Steccherinum ochraceum]
MDSASTTLVNLDTPSVRHTRPSDSNSGAPDHLMSSARFVKDLFETVVRLNPYYDDSPVASSAARMPAARELLEAELATLEHARLQVLRSMNQEVLIALLPPEVLGQVFLRLVEGVARDRGRYQWLSITWVCHHWRTVALTTPELWSRIVIRRSSDNVERTKVFLERSKAASLQIIIAHTQELHELMPEILAQVNRAESLSLSSSLETLLEWENALPTVAPRLRRLHIRRAPHQFRPIRDTRSSLSTFMAICQIPALSVFSSVHTLIDWSTNMFAPCLTRLSVQYPSGSGGAPISDVIRAFTSLPQLEFIQLDDVLAPLPENASNLPRIAMPLKLLHLKEVKLGATALSCAHFLQHIIYPASTVTALTFTTVLPETVELVTTVLASKIVLRDSTNGTRMLFDTVFVDGERIFLYSEPSSTGAGALTPHKFVILLPYVLGVDHSFVLDALWPKLPIRDVTKLHVLTPMPSMRPSAQSQHSWSRFVAALSGVEEVVLQGNPFAYVFSSLAAPQDSQDPSSAKIRYILPNLRRITVYDVIFRHEDSDESEQDPEPPLAADPPPFVPELIKICKTRTDIEVVVLKWCFKVLEEDIEKLQEVVSRVEWDREDEHQRPEYPQDEVDDRNWDSWY